jgi:membrane fusion protein
MEAEIFVPSRAIGFLAPGQEVRLRYDAFPYQRFGVGTGRIKSISSTVLRPDQIVATIRVEEPVYRVVVALDQDAIVAYGKRYRIRPGLALGADIVLDRRTFAEWLLDPIEALRGRL